ncbi:regakine-1-like [Saccopteryx bilineata]|uniref:regakine-1-like n=1 Tax=Saccopteryx bilineata TaxID=59482 RepID=UPI00338DC3B4
MRVSLALLAFLLTVVALHSEANEGPPKNKAVDCCVSFTSRPIPFRRMKDYRETSVICPTPGIIFTTIRERQICANPRDIWVQRHIRRLKQNSK